MDKMLFLCTSDHSYKDISIVAADYGKDAVVVRSKETDLPNLQSIIYRYDPAVLIAPPITAENLRTKTKRPVIAMHPSQFDLLDLLMRTRSDDSDTLCYIGYHHDILVNDKEFIERMLGKKLRLITYKTNEEKQSLADRINELGVTRAAVTGGIIEEVMLKNGLDPVLLHWKKSSISLAVNTAVEVLKQTRNEAKFNLWLNTTLNNVQDGIISTQQDAIFTFNKKPADFFGIKQRDVLDKNIYEISKDSALGRVLNQASSSKQQEFFTNIRGRICLVTVIPVAAKQLIIIIKDKNDINRLHASFSKEAEKRGMVSRYEFSDILGDSVLISTCRDLARKYAKSSVPILLLGETGVGKEVFAHSIHSASDRASAPFVYVNCSSISETMLETELFGYESTSSGNNKSGKIGLIELANTGTLFLDEIGELPLKLQSKLLSAIQNKELTHVRGNVSIPIDVRLISASNRNLDKMVEDRQFRKDLYYRISTLNLNIPPLRERREDIPILAMALYKEKCEEYHKQLPAPPLEYINSLKKMDWPGNIRELQSYMERYVILASETAEADDENERSIIESILGNRVGEPLSVASGEPPSKVTLSVKPLKEMETDIIKTLSKYYSDTELSRILDVGRSTVWRRMKEIKN